MFGEDKKVSIVVPVYNREKFLDKCITSLINQTYKNLEIILVDDGSKDNSLSICQKYADKDDRIKAIHKENGGVQSARNKGIDESTGYYLCFVDADDYVSENFISNFINAYNTGKYECVVCGHICVGGNYNVLITNEQMLNLDISKFETERWALYFERFACYVWNHMFITNIVKEHNVRFDKDIIIFDDTAFTMNYINHITSIGFTNSNDYYYVCEHDSLTVAKRLKNKRVNDGGCREKVKSCIIKYNRFVKNKDINDLSNGNLKWLSSILYHVAIISFILYISRVPYDYRYTKDIKDKQFDEFYYYLKNERLDNWHYDYNDLHTKLASVKLLKPTAFIFFKCSKSIFRLYCDIFGCNFVSNIFLSLRNKH